MNGWRRAAAWVAAFYVVFWFGGSASFHFTHNCVRSHQEEQPVGNDGDVQMVTVCDWYTANAKRWTVGDPLRVWAGSWVSGGIVAGIAAAAAAWWWRSESGKRKRAALE